MTYSVKEIYYTLQGEGAQSGRPAVFVRFSGCNLWSGREEDRWRAVCRFCDTEFVGTDGPGGGKFKTATELARAVERHWPSNSRGIPYVVCTGGEPLLQLDFDAVKALKDRGFEVAIESNGTIRAPNNVDWVCISPKAGAEVLQTSGNELKLVYPQDEAEAQPDRFAAFSFEYFFLQPRFGPDIDRTTAMAVAYCLKHPQWRLSLQAHKICGIP